MRQLMISLDKQILDLNSRVARRMLEYGQTDNIFIIIPDGKKQSLELTGGVHIFSTGGCKIQQFFKLFSLGKKLIQENNIEGITTQDPFFIGLIGVLLKWRFKIRLEVQLHGDFYGSNYYKSGSLMNKIRYSIGRYLVLPNADKIRVVGERIKESLLKIKIPEQRVDVRPIKSVTRAMEVYKNALERKSGYNVLKQREFLGYNKIFVWAGRMEPVKNLFFLIDVFQNTVKENPNWLLLLIGDGSERTKLEKEVVDLNLQNNIRFIPWVCNPFVYIANADAILFPSLSEGYGLTVMEAATVGTPVIMTDVGVANYELKPGPKVKIVPMGDKSKFIQAIFGI